MKNTNINLLKLKSNVDIDSIEMFHACLIYNTKIEPRVKAELEKWPMYLDYWNMLVNEKNIFRFEIKTSVDHLNLIGDYIKSPVKNDNNTRTIFLLHGITNTRYWIFKQTQVFLQAGYNVVWYDARNHGESDAAPTTFGKNESHDLQDVINFIDKKYNPKYIIIYGFSLGSATVAMWSEIYSKNPNDKVKVLICDSTFSRLEKNYLDQVNKYAFIPTNFVMNMFRKQMTKITGVKDLSVLQPIKYFKYIPNLPVLFLHGKSDNFISYANTEELYNEKIRDEQPIKSKMYLVEHAKHGQIFLVGDQDNSVIYDEYDQTQKDKISNLVFDYIDKQIN